MRIAPQRDLIAGITVGVVALPLALAFGITSGLGAAAGLITAVVAGTVAAVFGEATWQVRANGCHDRRLWCRSWPEYGPTGFWSACSQGYCSSSWRWPGSGAMCASSRCP